MIVIVYLNLIIILSFIYDVIINILLTGCT